MVHTSAGWRFVTVNLPKEQALPAGQGPRPLAVWGDAIEVQVRPAQDPRHCQLYARLRDPASIAAPGGLGLDGDTAAERLGSTLIRSKRLLEI